MSTKDYITRLKAEVGRTPYLESMVQWVADNTMLNGKQWSAKDHEYQVDIANCTANDVSVSKSAQVGMSELSVRAMLAYMSVVSNTTAIYVLPSAAFALKFSKARILPILETSPALTENLVRGSDAADYKRFRNGSDLYLVGSRGQQQAISIPANMLITDEVNYCNQQALATFTSRLQHAENGGIKRRFSTPTVEGYGISKSFAESDQRHYLAKCDHCNTWNNPDYLKHCRIPGWDDHLYMFEKEDLHDPNVKIGEIDIYCEKCDEKLNLFGKRQWVARYPNRDKVGFSISPDCVPKYRPPLVVFRALADYSTKADWVNMALGKPYSDETSSASLKALEKFSDLKPVMPSEGATACIAGIDVGKTSWITIGKRVGPEVHILYAESIRIGDDGTMLLERVSELFKIYGVYKAVIDSAPFADTVLRLISKFSHGCVTACYYRKFMTGKNMLGMDYNEAASTIGVDRTKMFDRLIKSVNLGRIHFGRFPELRTVQTHICNIKKVESFDDKETLVATWTSIGPDHYAHALQYLMLASSMVEIGMQITGVPSVPSMARVVIGSADSTQPKNKLLTSERFRHNLPAVPTRLGIL